MPAKRKADLGAVLGTRQASILEHLWKHGPQSPAQLKIATNMPAMSMAGPKLTAQDNGDGTYSAQTNLNYATTWLFAVTASAGGKTGTSTTKLDIK